MKLNFEPWLLAQKPGLGASRVGGLLQKWPAFNVCLLCAEHYLKPYMYQQLFIYLHSLEVGMIIVQFIIEETGAQGALNNVSKVTQLNKWQS